MYKLQALCVLVITILAFSQVSPVHPNKNGIRAVRSELEFLKNTNEVMNLQSYVLVPKDVQGNCTVNGLDCYTKILEFLRKKCKSDHIVHSINTAITSLEEVMGMNSEERKKKNLCQKDCVFKMESRKTTMALEDILKFLQRMIAVSE